MRYEGFVQEMYGRIQETVKDKYSVRLEEVMKCNDTKQKKLVFKSRTKKIQAEPAISLEGFFEMYQSGIPISGCERVILNCVAEAEQRSDTELWEKMISSWETAKEHVYPILVSKGRNEEFLKGLMWKPFLDLAVCYALVLPMDDGQGNMKIRKEHLDLWGIKEEEVIAQAEENNLKQGYSLRDMSDLLPKMLGGSKPEEKEKIEENGMYVLSNRETIYGAAKLLCKPFMEKVGDGKSFYILPSSVHELILLSGYEGILREELDEMVCEVNRTEGAEEEILSDHAYFYDSQIGEIQM